MNQYTIQDIIKEELAKEHNNQAEPTSEETIPAPAHGSAALRWTKEKPRADGWWWWCSRGCVVELVHVRQGFVTGAAENVSCGIETYMRLGGWWAGPIESPEAAASDADSETALLRLSPPAHGSAPGLLKEQALLAMAWAETAIAAGNYPYARQELENAAEKLRQLEDETTRAMSDCANNHRVHETDWPTNRPDAAL